MESLIAFVLGFVVGLIGAASAMRRAAKKPNGKTAKFVTIMGGGGPKPER